MSVTTIPMRQIPEGYTPEHGRNIPPTPESLTA